MDSIKSEVYKSLFRTSNDRDHLKRTIEELQQSSAGRTSKQDEIHVIIDSLLGYVRESEQKAQGEVEKAIQEASKKADEEIKKSLDASRRTIEDLEKQKDRFEQETLNTKTQVSDLQRQNKELRDGRDKEIQSAIESYYGDCFQRVNNLLLRNKDLRSLLQSQHESYLQDFAKEETENATQKKIISNIEAIIERLQREIASYNQELRSYEKKTAEVEVLAQTNANSQINDQIEELPDLGWQLRDQSKELDSLQNIDATQKIRTILDRRAQQPANTGTTPEIPSWIIHLDPSDGTLTVKIGPDGFTGNLHYLLDRHGIDTLPRLGTVAHKAGLLLLEADPGSEFLHGGILGSMTDVEKAMLCTIVEVLIFSSGFKIGMEIIGGL
ncbi:MAG: hypothetical protein Q9211_002548, partial [Gyalolechia sp. 1 TL-2023]